MRSFECPHCGAEVPARKPACPECGSDARTGWSPEGEGEGIAYEAEMSDEDYQSFLDSEFPDQVPPRRRYRRLGPRLVIGLVLVAFAILVFRLF